MIIVWRWEELKKNAHAEDTYPIKGNKEDLIVRMDIRKSNANIRKIINRVKTYPPETQIFTFLHRGHGYLEEDVVALLKGIQNTGKPEHLYRCFLFADGRDFIYYHTHSIGLLGQHGTFMNATDYKIEEENAEGQLVKKRIEAKVFEYNEVLQRNEIIPRYFNVVWNHYEFEFRKKIQNLRVDLLSYLTAIPASDNNTQLKSSSYWQQQFDDNKLLKFRLCSFLNLYAPQVMQELSSGNRDLRRNELKKLRIHAKQMGSSLVFDDCNVNLALEEAKQAYQDLVAMMSPLFTPPLPSNVPKICLIDIDQKFVQLIQKLDTRPDES